MYDWSEEIIFDKLFKKKSSLYTPHQVINLGLGWAQNTVNTVIFRHHGIISRAGFQFTAYYDERGRTIICKRNLNNCSSGIESVFLTFEDKKRYNAHNSISIGIDPSDYIHICYDHHASSLNYQRSINPLDISSWTDSLKMTGIDEDRVTYPTFFMLNDINNPNIERLTFIYRNGVSGKGDAIINQYDEHNKIWYKLCDNFLNGSNQGYWSSNAYWNNPVANDNLVITYVWRLSDGGPDEYVNNCNICFAQSFDGVNWFTQRGKQLKTPITQANSEVIRGIAVGENLINQTSAAADSKGNVHIVYYSNDENGIPQYQHLWFDGHTWNNKIISKRTAKFDLKGAGALQIPFSRPEILIDDCDNVLVIYRADFTDNKMVVQKIPFPWSSNGVTSVLWDYDLAFSEPVVDRVRWKEEKILSMFIQRNNQPDQDIHNEATAKKAEACYIVDWIIK